MITESDISRINELYHKMKDVGLTEAEKEEQARLRKAYIDSVKQNMRRQLENVDVVRPDGSVTPLSESGKRVIIGDRKYKH